MSRRNILWIALVALLLCFCGAACAQTARDITAECTFSTKGNPRYAYKLLYDHLYNATWETNERKNAYLEVTLPEGETCSGVQIKWGKVNPYWQIEFWDGETWQACQKDETGFLNTFTPLPNVPSFRIVSYDPYANAMKIREINVLSQGERPDWVQVWEPTHEKADLLLVVAHPDDEYVFMGGLIPYYSVEKEKRVVVAYLSKCGARRDTELLDGLWTVGQKSYPVLGVFDDHHVFDLNEAYKLLGKKSTRRYMVELFRKYKPDVVVTHDRHGEYGHGVHKLCADVALDALERSGDESQYKELAETYGVWDVPKLYLHLYPENQVMMDWAKPLEAFDGRTAFDMAKAGFACHESQQDTRYMVYEDGPYDSRLFGLVRSLKGEDVLHNDLFENLE